MAPKNYVYEAEQEKKTTDLNKMEHTKQDGFNLKKKSLIKY